VRWVTVIVTVVVTVAVCDAAGEGVDVGRGVYVEVALVADGSGMVITSAVATGAGSAAAVPPEQAAVPNANSSNAIPAVLLSLINK
jgi:hypothetical protein